MEKEAMPLEALGMPDHVIEALRALIGRPYGMIMLAGPAGSGKSATLDSILALLRRQAKNIYMVEEQAEHTLAAAIQQDPDVVVIGSLKDADGMEVALQTALTGRLVFSMINAGSAMGALTMLIGMGVDPFVIGSATIGVLAQRLVRTLCPACKEAYPVTAEMKAAIPELSSAPVPEIARAAGCPACAHTGYAGSAVIFEILVVDDALRSAMFDSSAVCDILGAAKVQDMQFLRNAGMQKVFEQVTSLEEIYKSSIPR